MSAYEYGVRYRDHSEPHRMGMTEEEAREWVEEFEDDGGRPNVFTVIRRPVGEWEVAPARSAGPEATDA